MYLEFNWTAGVYQPRFGRSFIAVRGWRSFETLAEARSVLASCGLCLGKKTDSGTWAVETVH
jgi:hypothetical protein